MGTMHDHEFVDQIVADANERLEASGGDLRFAESDRTIGGYPTVDLTAPDGRALLNVGATALSKAIIGRTMDMTDRAWVQAAGREHAEGTGVAMHDLAGSAARLGVPATLFGAWIAGVEDALEEQGVDTDPDSDGHGWERRALAGIA